MAEAEAEGEPAKVLFKMPADGCRTSVYALLAPGLPTGSYLSDCELTDVAPGAAKDAAAREELWRWTEEWVARAREATAREEVVVVVMVADKAKHAAEEPEEESV